MKIISILSAAFMVMNVTEVEEKTKCKEEKEGLRCPDRTDGENHDSCEPKTECTNPWLVSLQINNGQVGWHACAGVLIRPDWVLATVHCVESERIESIRVVTGVDNLEEAKEKGQHLTVDCYFRHEEYKHDGKAYTADIALIHLEKEAKLDECTGLADLSVTKKMKYSKCNCTEVGWQAHGPSKWPVFIQPNVHLLTSKVCKSKYSHLELPSCCICGEAVRKGEGFCEGDNGGVLVCQDKKTEIEVVTGIISWRDGCDKMSRPTVYTNIALYSAWINMTMEKFVENKCPCKSEDRIDTKQACPTTTTFAPTTTTTTTTTTPSTTIPTTTPTANPCTPPPNPCSNPTDTGTNRCTNPSSSTKEPCTIEITTPNPCETTTTTKNPCPKQTTTPTPDDCTPTQYIKTKRRSKRRQLNNRLRKPFKNQWIDFPRRKESRPTP